MPQELAAILGIVGPYAWREGLEKIVKNRDFNSLLIAASKRLASS